MEDIGLATRMTPISVVSIRPHFHKTNSESGVKRLKELDRIECGTGKVLKV